MSEYEDITAEAEASRTPDAVAFLFRPARLGPVGTYEELWVTRYDELRMVLATFPAVHVDRDFDLPGVVREVPVRRPRSEAETTTGNAATVFDHTVRIYVDGGWTLGDAVAYPEYVERTPEPWERTDDLDRPRPF